MRIQIVSPSSSLKRTGNRATSAQWAELLTELGHEVTNTTTYKPGPVDLLIALHAERSFRPIEKYRKEHPDGPLIVGLGGTDIYPTVTPTGHRSMEMADALIALQDKAVEQVPIAYQGKVHVIIQSAQPAANPRPKSTRYFDICVVGHLRDVKDPMLAAWASRDLPNDSTIRIRHAGGILDSKYESIVSVERNINPRYDWLGELSGDDTARLISSCHAMILSSHSEGGARVVGEAIVNGTPPLSTHIDGIVGLLGEDYPGYFPVGDDHKLAELMYRLETDTEFRDQLHTVIKEKAPRFSRELEKESLDQLVNNVVQRNTQRNT
ncbi:MAG: TIGR04348 family glycosyltransferase [Verrucomicrobiales bacterium]|nr:TIGR04348 family glycosyltransferase [Verrucomicrobiales bacterium]